MTQADPAAATATATAVVGGGGGGGVVGDTTYTKVFVGGLAWETQKETMKKYFDKFGEILEAVVILDKATGRSKGYGFVTFRDPDAAMRACVDANPVIDGRRANCNIASLGVQRSKPSTPKQSYAAGAGRNMRPGITSFQMRYAGAGLGAVFPPAATFPHYSIQQGMPFTNLYGYSSYNAPDYSCPTSYYGLYGGATQFPMFGGAGCGSVMNSTGSCFYPCMPFGEGSGGTAPAASYSAAAGQSYVFHYPPHHFLPYSSSTFPQHYSPQMSVSPTNPLQSGMSIMSLNSPIPHL